MAASPAGGESCSVGLFIKPASSCAARSEGVNAWAALPGPAEGSLQAG